MISIKQHPDINDEIVEIRREVFMHEQGISEKDEFEGGENEYTHFCLYLVSALVGYIRISNIDFILHIGRVAIKKPYRGNGYGRKLMLHVESYGRNAECVEAQLNAQVQAADFYAKLGYLKKGEVFIEAGIDHIKMAKLL
jgi:predicted GNAT family N-acyltransferase